ncbi:MAG: metallophosphoesterase [Vicinamibacterales bacterium]
MPTAAQNDPAPPERLVVGLVSDTHGLVRPECLDALAGVDLILHAGDVGGQHVLESLGRVAPVAAVHGNVDPSGAPGLTERLTLNLGGLRVHVSHGHEVGVPTPLRLVERYDADVIVFGHTHRALIERIGRQLVVNPGAAGAARFHLTPSVARLVIADGDAQVELVALVSRPRGPLAP